MGIVSLVSGYFRLISSCSSYELVGHQARTVVWLASRLKMALTTQSLTVLKMFKRRELVPGKRESSYYDVVKIEAGPDEVRDEQLNGLKMRCMEETYVWLYCRVTASPGKRNGSTSGA